MDGQAAREQRRARLRPVLAALDTAGESSFLDLCEMLSMLSEKIDGSVRWEDARVNVHIRRRARARKGT